jgi:hypothetical protein
MDVVAGLVIIGSLMGIAAMALVAWLGAVLLQRLPGQEDRLPDRSIDQARALLLVSSGQGKHRPSRGGPRIAA